LQRRKESLNFISNKISSLPPYLFSTIQQKKRLLEEKGIDVIDLGIGAPDLPTPSFIVDRLIEESRKAENHRYPPFSGDQEFKEAVAIFYRRMYDVELDPDTEVLPLIGSKEGIVHLMHAVINPGDTVLIPNPGYPVYSTAVHLASGKSYAYPLNSQANYAPHFSAIPQQIFHDAKMMLLNYPNNPTGATVDKEVFEDALQLAKKYQFLLVSDAAYSLVTFGDYKAPSILQIPHAKEIAVELGSLSKSFHMTGWRIGYAAGNKNIIKALSSLKSNVDTGQFLPIQKAAATALKSDLSTVRETNALYEERMEFVWSELQEKGLEVQKTKGTFFIWAKTPPNFTSAIFAETLLEETGVIVTPGHIFGSLGEGYFRISLSVPTNRLLEALSRMKRFLDGESVE
jgi:LL-diaminopimelate aminotransferase